MKKIWKHVTDKIFSCTKDDKASDKWEYMNERLVIPRQGPTIPELSTWSHNVLIYMHFQFFRGIFGSNYLKLEYNVNSHWHYINDLL